jgi:hypothetical protein
MCGTPTREFVQDVGCINDLQHSAILANRFILRMVRFAPRLDTAANRTRSVLQRIQRLAGPVQTTLAHRGIRNVVGFADFKGCAVS